MPAYTYRCEVCGEVFTRRYSFNEKPEQVLCPNGHSQVVRVFRPPVVVFKGSGFYITDHGNGRNSATNRSQKNAPEAKDTSSKTKHEARQPTGQTA